MDSLQEVPTAPNTASAPKVLRAWAAGKGIQLFDFAEIEALGALHPHKHLLPTENEVASLCYTSGTTGQPVGLLFLCLFSLLRARMIQLGRGLTVTVLYLFVKWK